MSRVELRNFGGEIYYIGGHGLEDCQFHGSPQCAFNPGGSGRLSAGGLQAGRADQAAEIVGCKGHTYEGCRLYDTGKGRVTVFGGSSQGVRAGVPYDIVSWDGRGERPWVTFAGTRYEICWAVRLGSWMRGRIATVDTVVGFALDVGHVRDIERRSRRRSQGLRLRRSRGAQRGFHAGLTAPPLPLCPQRAEGRG